MKGQSIPARGLNFFVSTGDGLGERRNFVFFIEKHVFLFLGITFGFSDGSKTVKCEFGSLMALVNEGCLITDN